MIDTIYILRHGFRINWTTDSWASVTGLPRDPPLAAFGETQAQEVADHFQSLPVEERPTAIFSSPFYRCIQTSKPIAQALGLPIFIEHGISEWYSPIVPGTGLHPRPASATSLQAFFPEINDSWSSVWYPSRKGEDVDEVHERTAGFLEAFIPEVERRMPTTHSRILLVSHAATVITLIRELAGDRELPVKIGCCTLTDLKRKIDAKEVLGTWAVKALASGNHLRDGILREWGFADILISNGKVIEDPGVPCDVEEEGPVGCQLQRSSL
jgi:transcription factor C subunit 7